MKKSELKKIIKEELLKEASSSDDTVKFVLHILRKMGIDSMVNGSQVTIKEFKFNGKNYPKTYLQIS